MLGLSAIVGAFAGRISPASMPIMTFVTLLLPCILLLCAITAVYWIVRFRFWVWIPLVGILANGEYLCSIYQLPLRTPTIPLTTESFKIATYNVGRFGKDHSGLTARRMAFFMANEQADILCFQEFTEFDQLPYDSLNAIFDAWPYSVITKGMDGENILPLAVYSKFPIVDSQQITFPYTPNNCVWVDIRINHTTIRVFNNHLQTTNINQSKGHLKLALQRYLTNDIIRAHQAGTINRLVSESRHPVIVAGDFNALPSSYTYRTMKANLKDGFRTAGHGWGYTYRYFRRLLRIDYIFHSPAFTAVDYYSPNADYGSDHNAVFLSFSYL